MDIVAINNQIVVMRAAVKQAKVHIVRKLSRQAKSLRAKKGSEDQVTKNARKADRMVKEISTIKELNNDEVSRFALTNRHTSNTLTKEMAADLSVLCMTKLSDHKAVALAVDSCRKKFDNWEKELPQLLKMCEIRKLFKLTHQPPGRLRQRSKKRSKPKFPKTDLNSSQHESQIINWTSDRCDDPHNDSVSENEASSPIPHEHGIFEHDHNSSGDNLVSECSISMSGKICSDSDDLFKTTKPRKMLMQEKAVVVKKHKTPVVPVQENEPLQKPVEKPIIVKPVEKPIVVNEKRIGDMEVKRFILSDVQEEQLLDGEQLLSHTVSNSTNSDAKRVKTKSKDSFFVRNDNESLSDVDIQSNASDEEAVESHISKTPRPVLESTFIGSLSHEQSRLFPSRHHNPDRIHNRDWQKPHASKFAVKERQQFDRHDQPYSKLKPGSMPNRKERRQQLSQAQDVASSASTTIHPSWDAKRKLKIQSQIHQFQGKKIKFDD